MSWPLSAKWGFANPQGLRPEEFGTAKSRGPMKPDREPQA